MLSNKSYAELLLIDPTQHTDFENMSFMGELFDYSADLQDVKGTEKGQKIGRQINLENLQSVDQARFHYYQANGWSNIRSHSNRQQKNSWNYDQEELTHEIFHLRSSLRSEGFDKLQKELQCQIYTNLGNLFSYTGRFIEAQQTWHNALNIIANFPMALGNIGQGYLYYGQSLYDDGHQNIFIYHAYKYLNKAISLKKYLHPESYDIWKNLAEWISNTWTEKYLTTEHDFNHFPLGKNKALRSYRKWCLENRLYINPLNDLAAYTVSANDILHLPSISVKPGDPPKYHTLFNQIKQEFGSARFLYYEGIQPHNAHFSDQDIYLVDTLEYAEYSYHLEKVKIAYRLIYSLFDKIAYLLNDYLQVGIRRRSISFKTLWHEDLRGDKVLRQSFHNNDNFALRGLYWLSKDLINMEDEEAHSIMLEPDARELADIRNHIEHKSFKVVQYGSWGCDDEDGYTYSIDRGKFEQKTLKLMHLTRSAIIYTSLAIHHEEKQKSQHPSFLNILPAMTFQDKV